MRYNDYRLIHFNESVPTHHMCIYKLNNFIYLIIPSLNTQNKKYSFDCNVSSFTVKGFCKTLRVALKTIPKRVLNLKKPNCCHLL